MTLPAPVQQALSFDDIMRQADVLAQSRIIPAAYRNRPPDIVAAGLAGIAFGWDVMTSLRNYHVIEGTASLRPEAMLALVRRAGHSVKIEYSEHSGKRACLATGRRADNGDEHMATFSDDDAERAGLAGKKNWQQYRDAMLTWRAVSQLCRVLFPDVVLGAGYTPDEIGGPMIEVPHETDPLASPMVPANIAKTELLEACLNDRDLARTIWGDRGSNPVTTEDLQKMIDRALYQDVQEAEIVSPAPAGQPDQTDATHANLDASQSVISELVDRFDAKVLDGD